MPTWQAAAIVVGVLVVLREIVSHRRTRARAVNAWQPAASARIDTILVSDNPEAYIGSLERTLSFDWNAESAEETLPAVLDHKGNARLLCPCCGYPTEPARFASTSCILCDYSPPLAESPEYGVARSEVAADLEVARANFRELGSSISPQERAEFGGDLSVSEVTLRRELREQLDYLMRAMRPDVSERWQRIDELIAQLRQAEKARIDERQSDT